MQKRLLFFPMILLCVYLAAWAKGPGQVVIPLGDEYIREWLVLGPFFPDDLDRDFLAGVGGEANIDPEEGDTVTTADGKTLTWKRYKSEEDIIDLLDAVGEYEYATAYAFCILQSQVAGDAGIYLGSDDVVTVWVNGNRVHHNDPGRRALSLDEDVFEANLKTGANRCLLKVSQRFGGWGLAVRMEMLPTDRAVISGIVADEKGKPVPDAHVRLEQEGEEIARAQTDASGRYWLDIHPVRGMYDLSATNSDLGDWRLGIRLREGERRTLNLTLKEAISIEGTLLMLDHKTPHVAVAVQAVMLRRGEPRVRPIATTLSDEEGKYRFINLKPGRYQVRCQVLNGYVYYEKGGNGRKWEYEEVRRRGSEEAGERVSEEVSEWVGEETQDESASPSLTHSPTYSLTRPSSLGDTLRVEAGKSLKGISFRFAHFKKGTWRNYDTLDGLVHNAIRRIYRDPDGVMWFATDGGGVSRYDGKGFVNFTTHDGLAYDLVWDICCDPDGVMWFATNGGGVSRYDGKEFINFTTKDGLVSDSVHAIHCDPDGVMWFGAWYGGVSRYDGRGVTVTMGDSPHFVNFTVEDGLVSKDVISIDSDPDGVLWFGTTKGVSRYDGKEFTNLTTKDGLAHGRVYATYCDPDSVLWFGTDGGGASRYDGRTFINFTTEDGLADNEVWDIYCDPDGVMWFATSGGVSRYDGKGFVNFTTADGLPHNTVNTIHRDPDGVMWFGTGWVQLHRRGGVCRYDGETFLNFTKKDGLVHNEVWCICGGPDGTIWLGMWAYGGGVIRYDGREFVNFTTKDGLASDRVVRIYRDADDTMWFGTTGGVSRCDGRDMGDSPHFVNLTTEDGLADDYVNTIYRDASGVMWFGTTSGVFRYDGEEFVNFRKKDGLVSNTVLSIHRDPQGVMWFGTFGVYGGGGLSRYDGRGVTVGDSPHFVNFTTEDGLAGNTVMDIHSDPDGVMWFATWGGVSRYDGRGTGDFPHFVNITTKDGLAHNGVYAIHRDPDGGMWFGTDGGGVSYYDGITWTSLDTRDGLAGNSVSSIYQDPDGYLWFATNGGLTRYRRNTTPPKVHIVSVTADQTYSDLSAIPAFAIGTRVTIEYDALDFKTIPEKQQYRCRVYETRDMRRETSDMRLSSLKSQVSSLTYNPPTKETSFDWTSKKPGTYVFEVQAIDRDLNYSKPASLDLTILPPPFYTSAGFIAGSIFSAFLIPTIIYALLLVRQKRGQVFETIPNPYIVGNPIRSKDMFFGREDDFQFIRDKLVGSPTGLIIVLAGERRSGKTSILYQIINGRLGERFVPVFIDMQAMTVRDDAEFFQQLAQETDRSVSKSPLTPLYKRGENRAGLSEGGENGAGLSQRGESASLPVVGNYDFRAEAHPAQTFQRYVDDLMPAIEDRTLLFLIDEYELLEAKVADGTLSGDSITFFAGLMERHSRVAFLFTGSRHLEDRRAPFWKVLLPKSIARQVSFLSERDTYRLVQDPVKGQVRYARNAPEAIYRLTAGQPFYAQVVCQNLIDRLNMEERGVAGQNDVIAVAREIEDNPLPQMLYFWDSFTQEQQWALSMLAELQEQPDQVVQATDILRTVKEYELPMSLSEADWRGALEGLCRREIVQRVSDRGEYRFRIDLFRPWVRHQRSIWEAQEVKRNE